MASRACSENYGKPFGSVPNYIIHNIFHKRKLIYSDSANVGLSPSKVKRFFQKRYMVIVAWTLCFILLVASIIYYMQDSTTTSRSYKICTTDECLRSAATLKYSMDIRVNPCEDFYQYACGRWSAYHPERVLFPTLNTFHFMAENVSAIVNDFFTSRPQQDEPKYVEKARAFYDSCMAEEIIDALEYERLFKYLEEAGLPKVPSIFRLNDYNHFDFDWLHMSTKLKKLFAMDVFIGFAVAADVYNSTRNAIYIGTPQGKSPLPRPPNMAGMSSIFPNGESVCKRIIKHILETLLYRSESKLPSGRKLETAVGLIFDMHLYMQVLIQNFSSNDYIGLPRSLEVLQRRTDEYLSVNPNQKYPNVWKTYIGHMFEDSNITIDIDGDDEIHVDKKEEAYLPFVINYLLSVPDIHLELYMWWITVFELIMNTTSEMNYFIARQLGAIYPTPAVSSRSLYCSSLVTTFMPDVVAYSIVDENVLNTNEPKVKEILENIQEAFIQNLNGLEWITEEEKEAIIEKTKAITSFIGYPKTLLEEKFLEEKYKNLTMRTDGYLDNLMAIVRKIVPAQLQKLHEMNNKTWADDDYLTVNAFYILEMNAINVPMAFLSFPIYNVGLQSLQYGTLGTSLGHELTHGFDNKGSKRDKYGNFKQWRSQETIEMFQSKAQCFIEQYDKYKLEGSCESVNGKRTLSENIADNGGLHQAFLAYQSYLAKNGREDRLPGFGEFTEQQMFFLGYGSMWCEHNDPLATKLGMMFDEHSPASIRVRATLQNSKEFAEAYNCPLGSEMNPDREKCSIW